MVIASFVGLSQKRSRDGSQLQCIVMCSEDEEVEMFSLNCFSSRVEGLPFHLHSGLLLMEM